MPANIFNVAFGVNTLKTYIFTTITEKMFKIGSMKDQTMATAKFTVTTKPWLIARMRGLAAGMEIRNASNVCIGEIDYTIDLGHVINNEP